MRSLQISGRQVNESLELLYVSGVLASRNYYVHTSCHVNDLFCRLLMCHYKNLGWQTAPAARHVECGFSWRVAVKRGLKNTYTVALPRDYANEITEFYSSNNKIFFQLNIYCLSLKVVACLWANMLNQAWCPDCWMCTFKLSHEPVKSEMNGDLRFDV